MVPFWISVSHLLIRVDGQVDCEKTAAKKMATRRMYLNICGDDLIIMTKIYQSINLYHP